MRIDHGKAWPHPVLRPPEYGDDYQRVEFQVDVDCRRRANSVAVDVVAEFDLSDPDLLRLVAEGDAEYILLVRSPKTHYRNELRTDRQSIQHSYIGGELSGKVEFSPFLVCLTALADFKASRWHPDFEGRAFSIPAGAVLAEDEPKEYWIDTINEAPVGAIMETLSGGPNDSQWALRLDGEKIQILLSDAAHGRLEVARCHADGTPNIHYIMNGLYLPALIQTLHEADHGVEEYAGYRWFSSLNHRLQAVESQELGTTNADRAMDAQRILEQPFLKMPIFDLVDS